MNINLKDVMIILVVLICIVVAFIIFFSRVEKYSQLPPAKAGGL